MNKLKLTGIVIAALLLVFALIARCSGQDIAARVILPIMAITTAVLAIIDIIVYRKLIKDAQSDSISELIRIVGLLLVTVLLLIAAVYINF